MRPSALLVLAWGVVRSLARRAGRPTGGLGRAVEHYAADRVRPLRVGEDAAIAGASRCIACGRCDEVAAGASAGRLPSDWILARLRDLTDRDVAGAPDVAGPVFDGMESACPAGVPFRTIADQGGLAG